MNIVCQQFIHVAACFILDLIILVVVVKITKQETNLKLAALALPLLRNFFLPKASIREAPFTMGQILLSYLASTEWLLQ